MEQDFEKTMSFFRFEDLRIYDKSLEYIDWVQNATKMIPDANCDSFAAAFNQSARAIAMKIAEGSARNKSQFVFLLKEAKSSVRECVVFTAIAERQGFFTGTMVETSRNTLMELTKMIGALIGSLQRSSHNGKKKTYHSEVEVEY
ncbi:MAG: four helix bundle protein [Bacteroidales bacterium]|nr:four helix bundle protein [Bacteroidales bacterium]